MPTPTSSTKTRLAEFFRSRLDSSTLHAFQNNADTDAPPPYLVVTVTKLTETTPQSNVFTAEVKIAIVTSIDMSSSVEHDALLEGAMLLLNNIPRRIERPVDPDHIRIFGWVILYSETVSKEESQSFSDVITIRAGVGG